jgi:hypothetical protein
MSDGSSDLFYNVQFSREFSINGQNNIIDKMIINENLINEITDSSTPIQPDIQPDFFEEDICYINVYPIIIGVFATVVVTIGIYILIRYI